MTLFLTEKTVRADPELMIQFLRAISCDAEFLRASYPGFDDWLLRRVIPGLLVGERTIVVERRESETVGLLIVKHSTLESKLCTLRVRPHHESRGLGVRLFETAFELLNTSRPLLSVSEVAAPKFERLFNYFGFTRAAVYDDLYLPKVQEISFNGLLDLTCSAQRQPTRQTDEGSSAASSAASRDMISADRWSIEVTRLLNELRAGSHGVRN